MSLLDDIDFPVLTDRKKLMLYQEKLIEKHVKEIQMNYEILNPDVNFLKDIESNAIDCRIIPHKLKLNSKYINKNPSLDPKNIYSKNLHLPIINSSFPKHTELDLPYPLPSPSLNFDSPFDIFNKAKNNENNNINNNNKIKTKIYHNNDINDNITDLIMNNINNEKDQSFIPLFTGISPRVRGVPLIRSIKDDVYSKIAKTPNLGMSIPKTDSLPINKKTYHLILKLNLRGPIMGEIEFSKPLKFDRTEPLVLDDNLSTKRTNTTVSMNTMSARFSPIDEESSNPPVGTYNPVLPEHHIATNFGKQIGRIENHDKFETPPPGYYRIPTSYSARGTANVPSAIFSRTSRFIDKEKEREADDAMFASFINQQDPSNANSLPNHIIQRNKDLSRFRPEVQIINKSIYSEMRVRRHELAKERAFANSKDVLNKREWKLFTSDNGFMIKNNCAIPDHRRASMSNINIEKLLDDPRTAYLFRARKWFLYIHLSSRMQVWTQAIIESFTDKVNSYKRKHAAIKIASWYKGILDERKLIRDMAIIKRILVRHVFRRRLFKKVKACKTIQNFFNTCMHQTHKDIVWAVQKFKHKIIVIQKAWRNYYPLFDAELKALETVWQHMVAVNKRKSDSSLPPPSTRARAGSFFFSGANYIVPPISDLPAIPPTSTMGDVTITTMLPSFRATGKNSIPLEISDSNTGRRFSFATTLLQPERKVFEMGNMHKTIDLNIIPADYNEVDRRLFLKSIWRERKIKFTKEIHMHEMKLNLYLQENLNGVNAARNLLLRKEALSEKLFRDEFLKTYPVPKWKAIPKPAELQELINIQSFIIKPTRFQHSHLLKKPMFSATGERASVQIQYIIITLFQMGYNPKEKSSILQAMNRGLQLRDGVSIENILTFSAILSDTEIAQIKIPVQKHKFDNFITKASS